MIERLKRMKSIILERLPESRLDPLTAPQLEALKVRLPSIPSHLIEFFEIIGCGSLGSSRYMIYDLISPEGIFDDATAANLIGIALIGDDFAGQHEAYDTRSKWCFGTVGSNGRFQPYGNIYKDFIDFIEKWYVTDDTK